MKSQLIKTEIDWTEAQKFIEQATPRVQSDLTSHLGFLKTVVPQTRMEEYPPRIVIYFNPKGSIECEYYGSTALLSEHERELKNQEDAIAEVIASIAGEHKLKADKGMFIIIREGKLKTREYIHDYNTAAFTLRPDYKQFRRQI